MFPEYNQNFNNQAPQQPLPERKSSGLNTTLLILLIILVGFGIWIISSKLEQREMGKGLVVQNEEYTGNLENNSEGTSNASGQTALLVSPKFGLKYPASMTVSEDYYLTPAQAGQGAPETQGAARATLVHSSGDFTIQWGGPQSFCMQDGNEFGVFQYGVSTTECVKGTRADLYPSLGKTLSQEALNTFGDFVLKNNNF